MNIQQALVERFTQALTGLAENPAEQAALIRAAQDPRHGDYQWAPMSLAKKLGKQPREVAQLLISRLDLGDMLEAPEVAGPGFVNLRLKASWLAARLHEMAKDERLGIPAAEPARTYVIDYSSPNVAKPLHVGHLRSSIIGDALTRLLRFLGHRVITDNHLGDWGTQFGILLYGYKNFLDREAYEKDPVQELARIYIEVRRQSAKEVIDYNIAKGLKLNVEDVEDAPSPTMEACRQETAKLHAGDPENLALWQQFMPPCLEEIETIYKRLDVLPFDHTHGESFYQPMLADVVRDLQEKGIAVESRGAQVIFFGDPEEVAPSIVQKGDGAYTYTTTDLATIRYRMEDWKPDVMLYVVGIPQAVHFKNLFEAARRWGYDKVELHHVSFGSVLGPDGKIMKTREGEVVPLEDLICDAIAAAQRVHERLTQEAIERGEEVYNFTEEEKQEIFQAVGIGALKYADLSQNRTSDYKFDAAKMTSTEGNTATYMQYAYVRNRGIFRKGNVDEKELRQNPPVPDLSTPQERALALMLLRFPEALEAAAADFRPNLITAYLWDLAKTYSGFFQHCPVLKAETPELRRSRLLLCDLTARVIQKGLDLLGIRTMERM